MAPTPVRPIAKDEEMVLQVGGRIPVRSPNGVATDNHDDTFLMPPWPSQF